MNLEMEKGTDALAAAAEAAAAARARAPALRRHRRRRDPRAAGADGGRRPALRRGRGRGRDEHRGASSTTSRRWSTARSCGGSRRSSTTAAPASRPTGWGSGRCPTTEILEVGARMAAVRGISHCYQRPTYADWPYSVFTMAHGRSKEECDAVLDSRSPTSTTCTATTARSSTPRPSSRRSACTTSPTTTPSGSAEHAER